MYFLILWPPNFCGEGGIRLQVNFLTKISRSLPLAALAWHKVPTRAALRASHLPATQAVVLLLSDCRRLASASIGEGGISSSSSLGGLFALGTSRNYARSFRLSLFCVPLKRDLFHSCPFESLPIFNHITKSSTRKRWTFLLWRRGRDSNPRLPCGSTGFRVERTRPLCDLSRKYWIFRLSFILNVHSIKG